MITYTFSMTDISGGNPRVLFIKRFRRDRPCLSAQCLDPTDTYVLWRKRCRCAEFLCVTSKRNAFANGKKLSMLEQCGELNKLVTRSATATGWHRDAGLLSYTSKDDGSRGSRVFGSEFLHCHHPTRVKSSLPHHHVHFIFFSHPMKMRSSPPTIHPIYGATYTRSLLQFTTPYTRAMMSYGK